MKHTSINKLKIFPVVVINAGNEIIYLLLTLDFSWKYCSLFNNSFPNTKKSTFCNRFT